MKRIYKPLFASRRVIEERSAGNVAWLEEWGAFCLKGNPNISAGDLLSKLWNARKVHPLEWNNATVWVESTRARREFPDMRGTLVTVKFGVKGTSELLRQSGPTPLQNLFPSGLYGEVRAEEVAFVYSTELAADSDHSLIIEELIARLNTITLGQRGIVLRANNQLFRDLNTFLYREPTAIEVWRYNRKMAGGKV